jgi:uncharacterized protein YcnI
MLEAKAKIMKKFAATITTTLAMTLILPSAAFAHVVVTPDRVGIGQRTLFSVSVPNERQSDVTAVKLIVPRGVDDVMPTVASGWSIDTTTDGDAVTAVTWSGKIPVGQRADFTFKAQAPGKSGNLDWKAYQTYADGTVVHWDQKPDGQDKEGGSAGPYSVTAVVDDLDSSAGTGNEADTNKDSRLALTFSLAALALSAGGLFIHRSGPRGKGGA